VAGSLPSLPLAAREGKSVEQIREDINAALVADMLNPDPKVQAYWKRIPCVGAIPAVEEIIIFLAGETMASL